jgi:H+/Cl- antiporter ClcA
MSTIGELFPLLWFLAFLSAIVAIFFATRFYALHSRRRPEPGRRLPLVAYVLGLLICAIIAFPFGLILGNYPLYIIRSIWCNPLRSKGLRSERSFQASIP